MKKEHRATKWIGLCCLAILVLVVAVRGAAEEKTGGAKEEAIVVVTNLKNPVDTLSRLDLQRMFLKQKTSWSTGERCVPINQSATKTIRKRFSKLVLGKDVEEMKRYWMQQTMTGNARPPIVLDGAQVVKRYIQRIPGGIAYIHAGDADASVKILKIKDLSELSPPKKNTEAKSEKNKVESEPPPNKRP